MNIDTEKLLDEADILLNMRMYDQAITKYNYIIEHATDCADAYLMRGAILGETGKIDSAISDIELAISLDHTNDSSYLTLAHLYIKINDEHQAIELCNTALKINSDNDLAKTLLIRLCKSLGNKMLEQGLFDRAEYYYELSLQYHAMDSNTLFRMALVTRGKGKIEESIIFSERAVEIDPGNIRAKAHIASAYELLGKLDKGEQLIEKLNHDYPKHPLVSIVYAQYALRNKKQENGITALTTMLNSSNVKKFDLISAKILLGNLYDSIEQYDSAFRYFKQANDLQNDNYDPLSYRSYISDLIENFSKKQYQAIAVSECLSEELIFIIGMPRSGTSLIEHIIASHTKVFGAGELTHVYHLVDTMQENFTGTYPQCLNEASTELMSKLANKLLTNIRLEDKDRAGFKKIIDKMPHNFHHVGFLHKLFPKAKFINCVRDPRDTCLSCYFQYFAGYHPYACNLHALGIHYREYERLIAHWTNTLNIPILTVSYEDVISNTKKQVERLLAFVDLEWEDNCLEFYKQERTVATASYNQVNKKIYNRSVGRWKNYKGKINELLDALTNN